MSSKRSKVGSAGAISAGFVGCSQPLLKADIGYAANTPALKLEQFLKAEAMLMAFEDRFSNLSVSSDRIDGGAGAGGLILDERFIYDHGGARRVWTIQNEGVDETGLVHYQGQAEDMTVWPQAGHGNVLSWSYDIVLSLSGQSLKVRFDDFIYNWMKISR